VADGRFDSIAVDNYGGALAMTHHLRAVGHARIAFVRGPAGNHDANERLRGYRDGLGEGLETLIEGDFSESSGYRAGALAIAMRPRLDAVFAANDSMAIGVLAAVRDARHRVPDDVAVVGFDDIPIARYLSPALTTVRVAIDELGSRALETLLERIESPDQSPWECLTLPAQLVVRGSCGAAAVTEHGPSHHFESIASSDPTSGERRASGDSSRCGSTQESVGGSNRRRSEQLEKKT
jgi:LacI family transcriptional regulator